MSAAVVDSLRDQSEAAKYLGVTPGTLQVWRTTRRYPLPFVKVGRLVRYRQSDLDQFLRSRTQGAVSQ